MKKSILLLVSYMLIFLDIQADGLTATLQQGDTMTPFYGVDAFRQAYSAADSGAVITLSSGSFNTVSSVGKSITIIGAYGMDATDNKTTFLSNLTISANDVKVEGLYISGNLSIGSVKNSHIKRCWIESSLESTGTHTNTLVDQCFVRYESAISQGKNYCLKNCTIGGFYGQNSTSNVAYITNCNIYYWYRRNHSERQPYAIYKNNILCLDNDTGTNSTTITLYSPSEFYNNYFYRVYNSARDHGNLVVNYSFSNGCINSGNSNSGNYSFKRSDAPSVMDASNFNKKGTDGTNVGITGGTGYSSYPAIPRITSSTIDSNTDNEGKLKVKINVTVQE